MNPWKIISDQEVETIHEATLRVLSEVGIVLDHPQIREQLADAGASFNGDRVQLPPDLVEKSIQICPKQVRIRGREG
ncbi:MAG: trimethylamine methyltransferase family protein, partial [Anaerolineales bacterium]|nr:trimethylamine methyltransferase family protein [Anaerolineales bacterium]